MVEKGDALAPRTQVQHYWILDTVHLGNDVITYIAEDMRLNRKVLLTEYYPPDIAKRQRKDDGEYTVYVQPAQSDPFTVAKEQLLAVAGRLKGLEHPGIAIVNSAFEANGTLYTVSQHIDKKMLKQSLEQGISYSEKEIGRFGRSLAAALMALQHRNLDLQYLRSDSIYMSKEDAVIAGFADFIPLTNSNTEYTIYELGLLMYAMMRGREAAADEGIEKLVADDNYSMAMCGLVNRMVSQDAAKRPQSLQEIQTLLSSCYADDDVGEPSVCETVDNPLSSFASLVSIVAVIIIGIYAFFYQPKVLEIKEVSMLDTARFHLVAYFGNPEAQRALGQMYEHGYGVEHDMDKAYKWYSKAASQGDIYAQTELAYKLVAGEGKQDPEKAHKWFLQAARSGDAYAQYSLGTMYNLGKAVPVDYARAIEWLQKAAAQKYTDAYYGIGQMHLYGRGVKKDYKKAFIWYKQGADRGHANAEMALGYLYSLGYGVKKDYNKAFAWYTKAAKGGQKIAQHNLALAYEFGRGTPVDYERAKYWYEKSAAQNYESAVKKLAKINKKIERSDEKLSKSDANN